MAGTFTTHVVPGESVEFVINERQQIVERVSIALAPTNEQLSDLMCRGQKLGRSLIRPGLLAQLCIAK